jgi:hypothetical protein
MSSRLVLSIAALSGFVLTSCYPYPENGRPGGPGHPGPQVGGAVTSPEQQEIQRQRDELERKSEELRKREEQVKNNQSGESRTESSPTTTPPKPKAPTEKKEYAVANPVPGKEGMVFSPYNNKIVDVRGIPSGSLVQDPTSQPSEKKYFRVP